MSKVFPPPALVPLVLYKPLAEHVKDGLRLLIFMAPCCMEDSWLHTVLRMLLDIPHYYPIITNLVIDVSVDWVLKGLSLLYLTL